MRPTGPPLPVRPPCEPVRSPKRPVRQAAAARPRPRGPPCQRPRSLLERDSAGHRLLRHSPEAAGGEKWRHSPLPPDRKSVVEGKSVSVRVDLGGRRIITKTKTKNKSN